MKDISIDCETLSEKFDAPVIAIGAVAFDRKTGKLTEGKKPVASFYKEVELQSAIKSGRVSGSTIAWWITQSDRAKKIFDQESEKNKSSLATVLVEFSHWYRDAADSGAVAWTNGPSQDITWLEHAYTVGGHGLTIPWRFNMVRDMRTIVDLATDLTGFDRNTVEFKGVEHNAKDDALYQARIIIAAYAALKAGRNSVQADKVQAALSKAKPTPEDDDEL